MKISNNNTAMKKYIIHKIHGDHNLKVIGTEIAGVLITRIILDGRVLFSIRLHIGVNYIIDILNFVFAAAVLRLNNKILDYFFLYDPINKIDINTISL